MFLDPMMSAGPGEPSEPVCRSCRQPIAFGAPIEELHFTPDTEHRLHDMNGTYHAECARPILKVKRAFDMLGRFPG